ncbi:MAG TPA: VWA domain-containing protein, partial [Gemmatimonadaceae bacterium]|nr:VWA domain-containing protein [Gemmatimonadaceae bacterium]
MQNYATGDSHQDVVLLLLDYLNGSWFTTANINSYLEDLSRKLTETRTPASVLLLSTKGLVEAHSFTTDMQSFNRAIQQIGSKNSKGNTITAARGVGWTNALAATTDVEATTIFREYALPTRLIEQIKLDRAAMTQQALEQLAESYRGIPGRKKLIWISTGFPLGLTPTQLSSRPANPLLDANPLTEFQIQEKASRAWRALSDANISVYPIDSNGAAITNSPSADFSKGPFGAPTAISIGTNTMSLMEVAKRTGGRFCTDEPDTCLKKALVDGPHYYVLGFYLSKEPKPGWHKLKVKVRRPETSVRAREGFFAGDRPQEQESKDRVLTALASPLDYTSVPLRLRWNTGTLDGKRAVQLVLNSPPGGVELNPEDSSLNLDILAYVRQLGAAEGKSFPA